VVDDDGRVRYRRGVTDTPGLYFLTPNCHLIAEIA
jgi:hypothetical protein